MKILITAIAAMLLLIGCDKHAKDVESSKNDMLFSEIQNKPEEINAGFNIDTSAADEPSDKKQKQRLQSQPVSNPDWDKKIIKTASLNLAIKDYYSYYTLCREKIRNLGGYVSQEEQSQSDYKIENTLSIKIPVDQFDNAIILLTDKVENINERKITSQDVTTEFVDTKSRMDAKKQVRQRYIDLLKQAKNMEEILSVQSEINGIQVEIESAAGRIAYLAHGAAYSTINLTFYQLLSADIPENNMPSLLTKISDAFKTGLSWITDLFIALVSIWPLLVLLFILVIFLKRGKTVKVKQA